MASKVLVKMPTVPFPQVKNPDPEVLQQSSGAGYSPEHCPRSQQASTPPAPRTEPPLCPRALDPVVRFLQEQHQLMLTGLHAEIDALKQRNRELQFQLVFSKNGINPANSVPSSPEDDSKSQLSLSPKVINEAPLQVELLEKELSETKISLQHANTRSACLAALVDEQNKKLESIQSEPDPDLQHALQEAERLVRCLRRENDDQRRELAALRAALAGQDAMQNQPGQSGNTSRGPRGRHQHNNGGGPGSGRHLGRQGSLQYEQQPRFPPLQTQSFWHQRGGHGRGGRHNMAQDKTAGNMALPNLRAGPSSAGYHYNGNNSHRRGNYYHSNGNHNHHQGNYRHNKHDERDSRPSDRDTRYERDKDRGETKPSDSETNNPNVSKSPRSQQRDTKS